MYLIGKLTIIIFLIAIYLNGCRIAFSQTSENYLDRNIQAPEQWVIDDSYQPNFPVTAQKVDLPKGCFGDANLETCKANRSFDIALEREYWAYVVNQDTLGMHNWLDRMAVYTEFSPSPNRHRLRMLGIFGYLFVYSANGDLINWEKKNLIQSAFDMAGLARRGMPRAPNPYIFSLAMHNFTQFAVGSKWHGIHTADRMFEQGRRYGIKGLAGPVGAVAHLMGTRDKALVRKGIAKYEQCVLEGPCDQRTSVAPFHYLGTWITMAEAYAYLGEFAKMNEMFERTQAEADRLNWPFKNRIQEIKTDLRKKDGLLDEWKNQKGLTTLRYPPGASHRNIACAFCHAGNRIPEWYHLDY